MQKNTKVLIVISIVLSIMAVIIMVITVNNQNNINTTNIKEENGNTTVSKEKQDGKENDIYNYKYDTEENTNTKTFDEWLNETTRRKRSI